MKTTLWLTTFAMFAASPLGFSNTELETLRAMVTERDRQIRQLEEENMKLRSLNGENVKPPTNAAAQATTGGSSAAPATAGQSIYTVKAGDTLAKIGRRAGTTPQVLARLNGIKDPSKLQIGQKIKLPATTAAKPGSTAKPVAATPAATGSDTHVVRNGDTFYSIARKYKLSAESLIAANPDIKPSQMRAGQLVRLRGGAAAGSVARTTSAPASKPAPTPVANQAPPAQSSPPQASSPAKAPDSPAPVSPQPAKNSVRSVVIDSEMTYGEFAAKHGTQIERLNELNGLDLQQNTVLAKGSEFYVTVQP